MAGSSEEKLEIAKFKAYKGESSTTALFEVPVHFNPASLQYTISNTIKDEGKDDDKKQFVTQSSAKLSMDLVFDTTHSGEDVRKFTNQTAKLLKPIQNGKNKKVPPVVEFDWGLYSFKGIVEQYKETLDFFAASGVPLRASVNITLSRLKAVFESDTSGTSNVSGGDLDPTVVSPSPQGPNGGPAGLANRLGDPRAARSIAALNGSASLRFGGGGELALNAGLDLKAAAAFSAGGDFGIGASAGAGLSMGAGLGGSFSASAGAGLSLSGGGGLGFQAGASAGVGVSTSGSASAFADLRSGFSSNLSMPDGRQLLTGGLAVNGGTGVQFGLGGQAQIKGEASLSADVGANADLRGRITFS